jgi:excisionase family DNA binding protein
MSSHDPATGLASTPADAPTPAHRDPVARLAYTVDEAIQAVPIGRTTMFALISTGAVRTITIGRRRLIPADALAELAARGAA